MTLHFTDPHGNGSSSNPAFCFVWLFFISVNCVFYQAHSAPKKPQCCELFSMRGSALKNESEPNTNQFCEVFRTPFFLVPTFFCFLWINLWCCWQDPNTRNPGVAFGRRAMLVYLRRLALFFPPKEYTCDDK